MGSLIIGMHGRKQLCGVIIINFVTVLSSFTVNLNPSVVKADKYGVTTLYVTVSLLRRQLISYEVVTQKYSTLRYVNETEIRIAVCELQHFLCKNRKKSHSRYKSRDKI